LPIRYLRFCLRHCSRFRYYLGSSTKMLSFAAHWLGIVHIFSRWAAGTRERPAG